MKDYLPFGDGFKSFIEAALIPSVVAVGLFALLVYPSIPPGNALASVADQSAADRVVVLGVSALVLAVASTAMRPSALALLEGHTIPRKRSVRRFEERFDELESQIRRREGTTRDRNRLYQRWRNLPHDRALIVGTRLGNRTRAAESYGATRYGIDTPTFYFELRKHAGEQVVTDLNRQLLAIDSMVSGVIVAMAFAASSLVVAAWAQELRLLVVAGVGALVAVASYYGAWAAAKGYIAAMRALVNEGRSGLAESFGVALPRSLEDERDLWRAITQYVLWGPGTTAPWHGTADREKLLCEAAARSAAGDD